MLTVLTSSIKYEEYVTDRGKNISIPCLAEDNDNVLWVKVEESNGNKHNNQSHTTFYANSSNTKILQVIIRWQFRIHKGQLAEIHEYYSVFQTSKYLVLTNVSTSDQGLYVCFGAISNSNDNDTTERVTANVPETTSNQSLGEVADFQPSDAPQRIETMVKSEESLLLAATEEEYKALQKIKLVVRTTPGPVSQLYFKPSTILGFLVWRFNRTASSGGYPVRSFTAEYRNVSYPVTPYNSSFEHEWIRMDPINIAPNVVN